jgi:hypothetical protein
MKNNYLRKNASASHACDSRYSRGDQEDCGSQARQEEDRRESVRPCLNMKKLGVVVSVIWTVIRNTMGNINRIAVQSGPAKSETLSQK